MPLSDLVKGINPLAFADGLIRQVGEDVLAKKNRQFQSEEAQKNRDFQLKMYDRQLDDSIAWREHQEQYNSPEAQMQRYRDAGINPMYAVTGNGGNMVTTPMSTASGYGTSTPSGTKANMVNNTADRLVTSQIETQEALAHMYNAQANEATARAEGYTYENVGKSLQADIDNYLKRYSINTNPHKPDELESFAHLRARVIAEAEEYQQKYQGLSFEDAKNQFMTSKVLRDFEASLTQMRRAQIEYDLANAKSAAEIMAVSARWAGANQWINAAEKLIGAAVGGFSVFKGTKYMPNTSHTFSESYGDHTSRSYNYNYNYRQNP